jgi:hypothetical protein
VAAAGAGEYELPRYITNVSSTIAAGTTGQVISSSLQLNQIPDKLIIFCRKVMSNQTNSDSDCFYPITGLSIQFNNQAGILSSAQPQDLFRYSVENGSNQNWLEFSGKAAVPVASGLPYTVSTSGGMLVLQFGKDINLSESFYASGSLGNFNLQINAQVFNNSTVDINANNNAEFVLITMNSGVFVCERGTSSTFTGILTKQDVLDASEQEPYYERSVKRMVGGGFLDSLKSVAGRVLPVLPTIGKNLLQNMDNKYAKAGASLLGALGAGQSGGGSSGGKKRLAERLM